MFRDQLPKGDKDLSDNVLESEGDIQSWIKHFMDLADWKGGSAGKGGKGKTWTKGKGKVKGKSSSSSAAPSVMPPPPPPPSRRR